MIESVAAIVPIALGVAALGAYAALVITALVKVVRCRAISGAAAIVWVVAILVVPLVASLAWFFVGGRTPAVERALRR